jgi:hypothetical protein
MLGVSWNPSCFSDFLGIISSLSRVKKRAIWLLFVAQSWALWHIRNKFSIENFFPNQPADYVFKCIIFLKQWRPLFRSKDLQA